MPNSLTNRIFLVGWDLLQLLLTVQENNKTNDVNLF
jgi:hypothetical protein